MTSTADTIAFVSVEPKTQGNHMELSRKKAYSTLMQKHAFHFDAFSLHAPPTFDVSPDIRGHTLKKLSEN